MDAVNPVHTVQDQARQEAPEHLPEVAAAGKGEDPETCRSQGEAHERHNSMCEIAICIVLYRVTLM